MDSSSAVDDQENSDNKDLELLETLGATTGQDLTDGESARRVEQEQSELEEEIPDISEDGCEVNADFPNARRTLMENTLAARAVPFGQCFEHFYRSALNEKDPTPDLIV